MGEPKKTRMDWLSHAAHRYLEESVKLTLWGATISVLRRLLIIAALDENAELCNE